MKKETALLAPNAYLCFLGGLFAASAFYGVLYFVCYETLNWPIARLLGTKGHELGFVIYIALYVLFFWGFITILNKNKGVDYERHAITILEKKFHSARIISKRGEIDALKTMITQGPDGMRVRNTALGQTLLFLMDHCLVIENSERIVEIFTRRIATLQQQVESSYSTLRYIAWAIPSLGFIGTVLGIGAALAKAGSALYDINLVTQPLGLAFDTTLIALLESMVLMFFIYHMQHKEESLLNAIDLFCQEKFIINLRLSNS